MFSSVMMKKEFLTAITQVVISIVPIGEQARKPLTSLKPSTKHIVPVANATW